jgi:hypothetical protein
MPTLAGAQDLRNLKTGVVIPDEGYADQPYVVVMKDGSWFACATTGKGIEGEGGQHVIGSISADQGKSWSAPIDIEPASGPEASWAVPLLTTFGRLYVFYTYNRDNLRLVPRVESRGVAQRVDTLGYWTFRYSDDGGKTWSKERYEIPLRTWNQDRDNNFDGKVKFFWSVCKPLVDRGSAYIGLARISKWGTPGALVRSRGFLVRSENVLTERDPAKIRWVELPDSDEGLRAPKGPISEETNLVALSDGTLYAVYRTIDGYLCAATSKDRGHTFTPPAYTRYAPGGRFIKNPRAFSFVRKFSNGKFLLWYHFNGGEPVHARERWDYYQDRNPGWVSGGVEVNGTIHWSEPEILLYDDNPAMRFSYPDFVEVGSQVWITETNKEIARCHKLDMTLLEGVWEQHRNVKRASGFAAHIEQPGELKLPALSTQPGFSLDFQLTLKELTADQVLFESPGLTIKTGTRFNLVAEFTDGTSKSRWESDYGTHAGTLKTGVTQHIGLTVDGAPRIVTWMVDGVLNDGGATRQFGWGRLDPGIRKCNDAGAVAQSRVARLHVYSRPLRTSEMVGNARARG